MHATRILFLMGYTGPTISNLSTVWFFFFYVRGFLLLSLLRFETFKNEGRSGNANLGKCGVSERNVNLFVL